jgi:hypothetical protein
MPNISEKALRIWAQWSDKQTATPEAKPAEPKSIAKDLYPNLPSVHDKPKGSKR